MFSYFRANILTDLIDSFFGSTEVNITCVPREVGESNISANELDQKAEKQIYIFIFKRNLSFHI